MEDEVAKQTYLVRRGAVYYFRMRITHDISDVYGKKKAVCYSLKTKDYTEAIQKVRLEAPIHLRFILSPSFRRRRSRGRGFMNTLVSGYVVASGG